MQAPLPFLMTRLAAWLGVAMVGVLVFWLLAPVLAPFVIAAVMAYVLHPLVLRVEAVASGRLPRVLAVLLVEVLALLALLGLFLLRLRIPFTDAVLPNFMMMTMRIRTKPGVFTDRFN